MIPITEWLPINSTVETTTGRMDAFQWLWAELERINSNPKRQIEIEKTDTHYRLIDYAKVKTLPDGMLIYGSD